MQKTQSRLICRSCLKTAAALDWRCQHCGGILEIENMPPFDANAIQQTEWSLWRYGWMLPVERHISLGEGMTPLVPVTLADGAQFHAKLEFLNPTGSYKDRGTATMMNHLLANGAREVVEDSSGNAGASVAAYSGAMGIGARIFAPASAPIGKKRLITSFGAELVEIPGPRAATTDACLEAAQTTTYASHAWNPFFIAGQMTCAWEIWEQLGRRAPDAIICPTGQGLLFLGLARGFNALLKADLIEKMPRLFAVQSAACDPVVRAWDQQLGEVEAVTQGQTVADGITTVNPVHGADILTAIRDSDGAAVRVDDEAILAARKSLASRGLMVEPTSATVVAVLGEVRRQVGEGARLVLPLTGSGLKTLN